MPPTTTFGATIDRTRTDGSLDLTLPPTLGSPALTPAVSREDLSDDPTAQRGIPVHSPFYQHPPASFERVQTHSRAGSKSINVNEKDLESGLTAPLTNNPFDNKVSIDCSKECKMWPSKQTLVAERKAELKKKREGQTCGNLIGPMRDAWSRQTKRNRLYMKIALGLVVVGVVVAVAVGITVAVNGSVYVSDNRSEKIPDPDADN